jgi:demethylmenaquinone methyltransferase/2-methoxy-6-polyprenyl-1,4-benzoquinol methylase
MASNTGPRQAPPERQVRSLFDDIVDRYDLVNGLLSLGLDRVWRRAAARAVEGSARDPVLDLGCGTGRLGALLARRGRRVIGVDLSQEMLIRAAAASGRRLNLVQGSAFALPFRDRSFTGAVSGFVLRNLDDVPLAFRELARVLDPGAPVALVDITEPRNPVLRRLFDGYFGAVAPALGGAVGKREAYRYLVESLAQLPPPKKVLTLLERAGFEGCRARALTGGMVTLFTGNRAA